MHPDTARAIRIRARELGLGAAVVIALLSALAIYWLAWGGGAAWITDTIRALDRQVASNFWAAMVVFLGVCFVVQLFIVPTGTITMLAGGFLFGSLLATGIYWVGQLFAAPLVFLAVRMGFGSFADKKLDAIVERVLPGRFANVLEIARSEGIMAAISLRLAPVITSAVVPILAAASGIRLTALMIGSVLVGWVRPLFWSSVGATAHSIAEISSPADIISKVNLTPILLAFAAAALVFALRIVFKVRSGS